LDLSANLIVQLGLVTGELNWRWYEAKTGQLIAAIAAAPKFQEIQKTYTFLRPRSAADAGGPAALPRAEQRLEVENASVALCMRAICRRKI
jgi:hypothetical protein